jgi:hypothetical protein
MALPSFAYSPPVRATTPHAVGMKPARLVSLLSLFEGQESIVMSSWFAKRTTSLDPGDPAAQLGAYKEGRRDERLESGAAAPNRRLAKAELDDAHELGRREERLARRASPLGMLLRVLTFILATLAVIAIVLAVRYGSFAAAGQAVDTAITSVVQPANAPSH